MVLVTCKDCHLTQVSICYVCCLAEGPLVDVFGFFVYTSGGGKCTCACLARPYLAIHCHLLWPCSSLKVQSWSMHARLPRGVSSAAPATALMLLHQRQSSCACMNRDSTASRRQCYDCMPRNLHLLSLEVQCAAMLFCYAQRTPTLQLSPMGMLCLFGQSTMSSQIMWTLQV